MAGSAARCSSGPPARDEPRVVPGAHRVEPERQRPVQQRGELDPLVAAHARVRRPAGGVLGDEVLDHVPLEPLGQVPDVERDAEQRRPPGGRPWRPRPCSSRAPRSRCARRGPGQRQVDADHLVPGLDGARRRHRGVHPAAHRRQYPHRATSRPARPAPARPPARCPPPGRSRRPAPRRRPGVEDQPSENRSAPRASASGTPIASSTWLGCGTPAWQAEPGRALHAAGVQQVEQRVALAAGEGEVGVAGQPVRPGSPRSTASGTAAQTAATSVSRSPASRWASPGSAPPRPRRPPPAPGSRRHQGCRSAPPAPARRRAAPAPAPARAGPAAPRPRPDRRSCAR